MMRNGAVCFERAALIFFFFSVSYTSASSCMGQDYVVPDHLRCAYINVALASFGGQCVGASLNDNFCSRVIDGNAEAGTDSYEWWHGNGGVGSWVQINFTRKFVINTIRVKQRPYAAEQSKGLKLTFMDGSEEYVELTQNQGVDRLADAVWDERSFADVLTDSVKVEVESVYTTSSNGFKEIQFYHNNCITDQLSGFVVLPAAKTTEPHPVSGKSISVLIQAAQSVSVILHEKPQATSARYRFKISYNSGVSGIYRSAGGGSETLQHSQSTPNALVVGQSRPFWIDFRSSNLVLGSGGDVLLQWNDQSPFSLSYVSFTANDTQSTTITMFNRQKETQCYKDADHLMPLDRYVGGTFYDLIGSKHGKGEKGAIYGGIGYKGLTTGVAEIKTVSDQTIDFGYFGNCISDFALCPYGISIGFWFWAKSGADSDILYSAENNADRGLAIFYATSTSKLTANIYSTTKYGSISLVITPEKWYHIFIAWRENPNTNPWMVVNGADAFWGTVLATDRTVETHHNLLIGRRPTGGSSDFKMSLLVIYSKIALGYTEMRKRFHCVGMLPSYSDCPFIEVNDRISTGWAGITEGDCVATGFCYLDSTCFHRDGQSDYSKLGVGWGSSALMTASSYTTGFIGDKGRLTWRLASDTSWSIEAWKPQSTTGDQWVEVDVNQVKTITKVATQGRSSSYVMTYTVSHSKSALWEAYLENNAVKLFTGNTDASSVVQKTFTNPFVARKVRLHIKSWNHEPVLRMELYGKTTPENYVGCYLSGPFKACGDYGRNSLTPEICTTCCGKAGYTYSAVKRGDQCLCSDSVDAVNKVGEPQCDVPCTGNPIIQCGGRSAYNVYNASGKYDYELGLTMPTNVSVSERFNATFSSYMGASYTLDFGEGILVTTEKSVESYLYHSEGTHIVYGQALLGDYGEPQLHTTSLAVSVYSFVNLLELNCPSIVEANEEFGCPISVYEGTDMQLDAQFTTGSAISSPLDDARTYTVGEVFQSAPGSGGVQYTNVTVLLPSYRFEDDCKLIGWRICTETTGFVSLQIYRKVCGTGPLNLYCNINSICTEAPPCGNTSATNCNSGEVFSFGSCTCNDENVSPNTIPTATLSEKYELVSEHLIFVSKGGCHIFSFDDIKNSTDVKEGDIIGFTYQGGGHTEIISRKSEDSKKYNSTAFYFNDANLHLGSVLITTQSTPSSISQLQFAVEAVCRAPAKMLLLHTYAIGHYYEQATVSGPLNSVTKTAHITATESVANVTMTTPEAVATNDSFILTIHPHPGYNITYVVNYGSGYNETSFTELADQDQLLNYEYRLSSTYSVSLHASNILSFSIKTCTVVVQDRILGLAFYSPVLPVALGNITFIQWLVRQGDGINITVDFGDGTSYHNGSFDVGYLFAAINNHTYAATGEYAITINVSNCVSNASIETLAIVELPVTGLTCTVHHAHRDIEVNETVTVEVTITQGTNPEIFIDFGDGSATTTRDLTAQHSYSPFDFYNVSCSVYNNISMLNASTEIQVHKPVDPLIGFNVTCSHTNLTDLTPCMLNISIGTDFTCTWDWGDGTTNETVFEQLGNFTYHNYSSVGHFHVQLNCSNRLNKTTAETIAIVEEPIIGFEIVDPIAKPFAERFSVYWNTITGTDAIFNATFTHIIDGTSFDLEVITTISTTHGTAMVFEYMMPDIGIYELMVTAINYVTPRQTRYLTVMVDVPIDTPLLTRSSQFVEVNKTANFSCQMAAGSNVSIWWDFGDGSDVINHYYQGNFSIDGVTIQHVFMYEGIYTVTLFGNNSVSNFTRFILSYIQNPHYLTLTTNSPQNIPPGTITFTIAVVPGQVHPTNSNYTVNYGDGTSVANDTFLAPLILQHSYGTHGAYTMNITVNNEIHLAFMEIEVEVQTPITNFSAVSLNTGPEANIGKPGFGHDKTYFPCDFPVLFNTTIATGTNVTYYWDFSNGYEVTTSSPFINYTFEIPNLYAINITAWNAVSKEILQLTVRSQCMVKTINFTNDGPQKLGLPINFTVGIKQVGTESCFLVEIGDNKVFIYKTDLGITCEDECSKVGVEVKTFTGKNFSFDHTYSAVDNYPLLITGCNKVSKVNASGKAVTLDKPCDYPVVTIDSDAVGSIRQNAVPYYRWKSIKIKNTVVVNCEASDKTNFTWIVKKWDVDSGSFITFPLIGNALSTSKKLTMEINPMEFSINEYYFEFTCAMADVKGVEGSSEGYINVIPSDIEAAIAGGSTRAIGEGKEATIDASDTKDPDVPENDNSPSDFQYCWFCAKQGSYDPELVKNCTVLPAFPLSLIPHVTANNSSNNETQSNSTVIDEDGCFGYPPGRLNASTPQISFNTLRMRLYSTYDVCVLAMKDTRRSVACTSILLVEGDPPIVHITCVTNCNKRIGPSNKMALSGCATCETCTCQNTNYEWKILKGDSPSGPFQEVENVESILSTPKTGRTLVVKANSLEGGKTYTFRLEAWAQGTQTRGFSEYTREVNVPPQGGVCNITSKHADTPDLGFAFQDDFQITCKDWQDDTKLKYKVSTQSEAESAEIPVPAEAVLSPGVPYTSPWLTLSVGLESRGYRIDVFVRIQDEDGAITKYDLQVRVEMPQQSAEEKEALLANQKNNLKNLIAEGNPEAVLGAVGNLASAFLAPAASSGESSSSEQSSDSASSEPSEEEKQKQAELQEQLLDTILKVSEPSNPDQAVQIAGTLTAVGSSSEPSDSAKEKMADVLSNTMNVADKMNSEQLTEFSSSLLGTFGTLLIPSSQSSDGGNSQSANSSSASPVQQTAMGSMNTILGLMCAKMVPGEAPNVIEGDLVAMGAAVADQSQFTSMQIGSCTVEGIDGALDPNSSEPVQAQMTTFSTNPFGGQINGAIAQLVLRDGNGNVKNVSNLTTYMDIFIPDENGETTAETHTLTKQNADMLVINVNVTDNMSAIYIWAIPEHNNTQLVVLCRKYSKPTLQNYDFRQMVPKAPIPSNVTSNSSASNSSQANSSGPDNSRYLMFIDNDDLNQTAAGPWHCGFYYNGSINDTQDTPDTATYNITIVQMCCKYLNETTEEWEYDGCKPGPKTTVKLRHCRCNHLTSFASDFFVPPNKIDWNKVSLEELLKNPLVFSVVCGIFGLYFLLLIWARRADRKDLEKVGVAPLPDNDPRDTYMYEVVVYTGFVSNSGTSSEVRIVLTGGLDETTPRCLKDTEPGRRKFCRGNVDYFLLSVPQCLGKLKTLKIWHDNTGPTPSWYLLRVMVHDVQTEVKTWFICDRWLAVEEDDGLVERTLIPASKDELTSFNLLFSTEARKNLTDNHLWFSVVARPAKSNFTRVQRLSCCLSVLLSTMLANAMFYQVGAESSSGTSVHVGPFSFSIKQLSIGITSSLVVLPANILIVTFFRKARPKEAKEGLNKNQDPHGQSPKYEMEEVNATVTKEEEEVEEEEDDGKKKDKKKKKKTLPHCFVYIAYVLVFITCTVSATFTIFYGLTFGKEKSEGWISSMMISFWQDVLISQPLKVFAAAMFFAVVVKDPNKAEEENEQESNELNPDEEALHSQKKNSEEEKALRKIGFVDKPPDPAKLEAARKLKVKQKEMKIIIREVIQYVVFLCVLLVIAYGSRDPMAFTVTRAMRDIFDEATYSGNDGIEEVDDYRSYWSWVEETFIPTLMPRFWYGPFAIDDDDLEILNKESSKEEVDKQKSKKVKKTKIVVSNIETGFNVLYGYNEGFVADHSTAILVGTARLRQLRIQKGKCKLIPFLSNIFDECNVAYDWDNEDSKSYKRRWEPVVSNKSTEGEEVEPFPWTYQSQWALKGTPYWGTFATYWGGGYVADFGDDRSKAEDLTTHLESNGWIDRYTRAIFAEFTIYNAQTNFFSVITLLSEILPTGGYYHHPKIQTLRLYRYVGPEMAFVMACEITYMAFLLYFLYKQVKKYRKERRDYFRDPWNYPELLVLCFSLSAVGLFFARLAITKYTIGNMLETPGKFVSFQYVAFLDEWVSATTAFAVFFSVLKFLRLLKFNRRVSLLIQTIKIASKPLMSFMMLFFVLFLAFCQFAYAVFGVDNEEYATFPTTLGSMMSMTLGSFDFHALTDSSRILGPMFFFGYVVSVFFVLMNVFIGILNDALNTVANDVSIQSNEHELLDFMLHSVKKAVGKQVGPAIKPAYKEPKNQFELNLDSIEEMSENVQYALRNICMEDIRQATWFEPENASKKKKIMMMMVLETDEDFTENDICDNIPLFDEVMKKHNERELLDKLICYREQKRLEEEASQADDQSDNSSDNEDESENDSDSEDDNQSVASDDSSKKPGHITLTVEAPDDEEIINEIEERYSPRPVSGMKLLDVSGSSNA